MKLLNRSIAWVRVKLTCSTSVPLQFAPEFLSILNVLARTMGYLTLTDCTEQSLQDSYFQGPLEGPASGTEGSLDQVGLVAGMVPAVAGTEPEAAGMEPEVVGMEPAVADKDLYSNRQQFLQTLEAGKHRQPLHLATRLRLPSASGLLAEFLRS